MSAPPVARINEFFAVPSAIISHIVHWSKQHRYIYVETPKAACTTVKCVLQAIELNRDPGQLTVSVHDRSASPLLRPSDDVDAFVQAMRDPATMKFCFVRHPYTRALSAYLDRVANPARRRPGVARNLGLRRDGVPTFEELLHALRKLANQGWQSGGDGASYLDFHWAPQTMLLNPSKIRYDQVGRFETFTTDIQRICTLLSMPVLPQQLEAGRKHATGANAKAGRYLTAQARALIEEIYAEDFAQFDYPRGA